MASLLSMQRCLHSHCNCNCHPHGNCIVAIVDAQASLSSSSLNCCPCNNNVVAFALQRHCCPCCDGVVAILKLASLLLLQCAVVIINIIALVAHCQAGIVALVMMALAPLMRRRLCPCCHANCRSCHNGIVAVANAQESPLLLSQHCCPHCLLLSWHHCPCCDGIVAVDAQASLLSLELQLLPS